MDQMMTLMIFEKEVDYLYNVEYQDMMNEDVYDLNLIVLNDFQ
jgi:hypothetical protein